MRLLIMTLTILLAAAVYTLQVTETQATSVNIHSLVFEDYDGQVVEKFYLAEGADLFDFVLPDAPVREGYIFLNWSANIPDEMPNADVYIVAIYMQQELRIRATI